MLYLAHVFFKQGAKLIILNYYTMETKLMQKYELEYIFIASPKLLYSYISNASGLSEWFAEKVVVNDNIFTFTWEETSQKAVVDGKKDLEFIRFKWVDDEFDNYFEFKIKTDSILSEITFVITDFAFEDDMKEVKMVWNAAITKLLRIIGGKLVNSL